MTTKSTPHEQACEIALDIERMTHRVYALAWQRTSDEDVAGLKRMQTRLANLLCDMVIEARDKERKA